jgi:subtilase family serine protease
MQLRKSIQSVCVMAGFSFLLAFAASITGSPRAEAQTPESSVVLARHTPRKVLDGTATRISHYDPEQKLRLAIFVTPRDLPGQEKLLNELQDKKSPNFHKFLSAEEWNERFGPTAENEQAVVDWANSQGLTVTNRFDNRMLVDVEAPSGVIEKALNVTINKYQVGDEVDFSNDRDPSIPARLSGVIGGIFGMQSVERVKPVSGHENTNHPDYLPGPVYKEAGSSKGDGDPTKAPWAKEAGPGQSQPATSQGESTPNPPNEIGTMDPANLYSSEGYSLNALYAQSKCCNVHNDSTGSPADTSIALVTFANYQQSDVNTFFQYYGLAWNTTAYEIDGNPPTTSECTVGNSGCPGLGADDEADLDVEWSTAFSNSFGSSNDTAHVYIYEGGLGYYNSWFDIWNYVLSDKHAHVASTSWAWTEDGQQSGDPGWMTGTAEGDAHYIFNALVGQGNTLIAAAGDQGPTSGCQSEDEVFWPANDPDFLAAGGTSLTFNTDGTFSNETSWVGGPTVHDCQTNGGGGGGGISKYFSAPSWQSGITYEEWQGGNQYIVSDQPNRMMPDMSLNATGDFQWYFCTDPACPKVTTANGWQGVGGTSIVAPELAGFFAQVNSYLNSIGHICGSGGTSACEPIGNPDPILYYEGMGQAAPHNPFYDTAFEDNSDSCVTNYYTMNDIDLTYFCSETGYDLATGWGSANLLQLAWAYNFYIIPSDGVPSVSFSGPATNTWYNTNQTVSWTVSDGVTSGTAGLPAPGVAGFTQGWDSIPGDVYSEPHGGSGNSFYSGPQYPYATSGCLAFSANGCSGNGGAQGCHTVQVQAWDNQGFSATKSYGPLCYDNVAPNISLSTNPSNATSNWVDQSVVVTLNASDPGGSNASGIANTYYGIDTGNCYPANLGGCSVYSVPFNFSTQGMHYIYYFTEDNAGNFSTETYVWVYIDTTKPVTAASLSGTINSGTTYQTAVQVTLSASTTGGSGVANIYYQLDGGAQMSYGSPFTVSTLGSHSVKYWSVSGSGEVGNSTTTTFSIVSPTSATLVASPNPALLGGSVKMTATIAASVSGTPTGTVTFWNGATNLGTGTLSGGVATLTTTTLPAGLLTLQVSYPATGNFLATNSAPYDETVNEKTSTTVTSSLNPAAFGQSVTFTATVAPSSSGTPTGSVSFYAGTGLLDTVTLNSSGMATFTLSSFVPGTYSITAVYSGDSTYLTSTSTALSEKINKATQTITFTTIPNTPLSAGTVTANATASSGLPVSFESTTTSICSVSGNTVTLIAPGACKIEATQAGNTDYSAATAVTKSFTIEKNAQTITFTTIPNTLLSAGTVTVSATASSGLPVSFESTTTSICSVSGDTVTLIAAGSCKIEATQAGNADYSAASAVTKSFTVEKTAQTITFTTIPNTPLSAGTVTVSATASSGLPVSFESTTTTICSVSSTTVTLIAPGSCKIEATQAGNADYSAATAVTKSFTVEKNAQTITFPTIPAQIVGANVNLSATASSSLTVAFESTTTTICSVAGNTATMLAAGNCTIEATQAGNSDYLAAPAVKQTVKVTAD